MNTKLIAEAVFLQDLITRKFPTGIVSVVCDSFDFWAVLTDILPALKDIILAREASNVAPGKLVIRPDSGDPVEVVCGLRQVPDGASLTDECLESNYDVIEQDGKFYRFETDYEWSYGESYIKGVELLDEVSEAEVKGAIQLLWETFGGTETATGHKLLDSHIGLIYGDSITTKRAEEILRRLVNKGFASGNVVFGVGSYTYQCNTRDTFGFAVKATYTEVNGEGIAIFKDPKTDSKKKSAKGLLSVREVDGQLKLYDEVSKTAEAEDDNMLETIFKDGEFVKRTSLQEIRSRLN